MSSLSVKMDWKGGLQFEGRSSFGNMVITDARKDKGGSEKGARPTELLLFAVASCTGMDVVSILQKQRQKVESIEIEVTGYQPDELPKPFETVEVKYIVRGENIDEAKLAHAIELSETKYCAVSQTVKNAGKVITSYEIRNG